MTLVSMSELMTKFMQAPKIIDAEMKASVLKCTRKVRDTATRKFGTYQPAVGGYPAWAKLKSATVKRKLKAGGGEDPLIGHYTVKSRNRIHGMPLMSSISDYVTNGGWTGVVGTDDPLGPIHEYGAPAVNAPPGEGAQSAAGKNHTAIIPPRPFLRPALFENQDFIKAEMENAIIRSLKRL